MYTGCQKAAWCAGAAGAECGARGAGAGYSDRNSDGCRAAATIAKITDRACAANVSHVTIELRAIAIGSFGFRTLNTITI